MARSGLAQAVVRCKISARAINPLRNRRVLGIFILTQQVAVVDIVDAILLSQPVSGKTANTQLGRLRILLSQDFSVACQAPALPGVKGELFVDLPA